MPPAFSDSGSKPPPIPALEQNSAIGPNCRSVSSITCLMSASLPTSHLNAAPPIDAATASARALIEIGDHDLGGAGLGEGLAHRLTDAVAAAGDDDDLARNLHCFPCCVVCWRPGRAAESGQHQIHHRDVVAGGARAARRRARSRSGTAAGARRGRSRRACTARRRRAMNHIARFGSVATTWS